MAERALNLILDDINTTIKTVSFGSKITTRGLCYLQVKDERTFPIENKDTRNARKISWDDKYPLQIYHRILEVNKETDPTQGFGKNVSNTRVYTMRLVGIGSKTALSAASYEDNQEIAKAVADAIPSFLYTTEYIEVTDMEVIKQEVYDSEWAGVEMKKLSLEGIAFWVDYELKITNCGTGKVLNTTVTVKNSDESYSALVQCSKTLILPDITIIKNDDTTVNYPAAKDLDIGVIDPCVPAAPADWDELVAAYGFGYQYPNYSGHQTSYRTGDDKYIEDAVFAPIRDANSLKAVNSLTNDFLTLNNNNAFGNTLRFTDSVGAENYDGTGGSLTDYVVDHLTGLGWGRKVRALNVADWNTNIDENLGSDFGGSGTDAAYLGFTNWFTPSENMLRSIDGRNVTLGGNANFRYFPFRLGGSTIVLEFGHTSYQLWTSTVHASTSANSRMFFITAETMSSSAKTAATNERIICRKHY